HVGDRQRPEPDQEQQHVDQGRGDDPPAQGRAAWRRSESTGTATGRASQWCRCWKSSTVWSRRRRCSMRDLVPQGYRNTPHPPTKEPSAMAEPAARIDQTPEWQALRKHHQELKDRPLRELFAADPSRGETMTCEAGDLYLDYSKQRGTGEARGRLGARGEGAGG